MIEEMKKPYTVPFLKTIDFHQQEPIADSYVSGNNSGVSEARGDDDGGIDFDS